MGNKRYEELTFTDDFMFCKVLSNDEDICKELLELILGIKIRKIVIINKQQEISITADAKSVRLDVYVEDDDNSVYDIEMETSKTKNLPKRSRYYQGMIDLNIIERGDKYDKLKKSFVIFICLKDPFDKGLHIYTFENKCNQSPDLLLGDETVKVFINAAGTADDVSEEMAEFLKYLKEGIGDSHLVDKIHSAVKKARDHVEWRTEYMSLQLKFYDIWDEARDDGFEEGKKEGLKVGKEEGMKEGIKEGIKEGMKAGKEEGMKAGMAAGKLHQLFELVSDNIISVEEAYVRTELTKDQFIIEMDQYLSNK